MKTRIFSLLSTASLIFSSLAVHAFADNWQQPEKAKYYSANKNFYVKVTPKKAEKRSSLVRENESDRDDPGITNKEAANHAQAEFYARKAHGGYSRRAKFPLVNEVAPGSAIVSDSGDYLITFDNWYQVGYGDDVVAIYRTDGMLVRKFSLEDLLTAGDIATFSRSSRSRDWGGEHYIDEPKHVLVLRILETRGSESAQTPKSYELKIDLSTGRPLEAKRDLLPQPRVSIVTDPPPASPNAGAPPATTPCLAGADAAASTNVNRLSPTELMARVTDGPVPAFPPIAKAAHASGYVIVEVLLGSGGEVLCARALSGPVLLRATAVYAVRKWKYTPSDGADKTTPAIGTITMNFDFPNP